MHWFLLCRTCGQRRRQEVPVKHAQEILGLRQGDGLQGDHINHNTLDNRRENLRSVTQQDNIKNQRRRSNNTSGYKGVSFNKLERLWVARIQVSGKSRFLGYFADKELAARAYDNAAIQIHGEFASLNFTASDLT